MYRISSLFKAVFWCARTDVGALVQIASCDHGSYEEICVGPFASSDDSGAPFEVGSSFENGRGRMNSTMMDGPAVALDSGSAFSGLVEIRAASLVGDCHVQNRLRRKDAYAVHVAQDSARIELVVVTALARERGVTRVRRSLLPQWRVRRRSVTPIR